MLKRFANIDLFENLRDIYPKTFEPQTRILCADGVCLTADNSCEYFRMSDGFNLFTRRWSSSRKADKLVLCIHGFGGSSLSFRQIGRVLAQKGTEVYGVDLRGFGNSKEKDLPRGDTKDFRLHLQDVVEVTREIRDKHDQRVYVLGHSLGGLYALWYAANFQSVFDGAIVVAPAVDVKPRMSEEDRKLIPIFLAKDPGKMIAASRGSQGEDSQGVSFGADLRTTSFSVRYLAGIGSTLMRDKIFVNAAKVNVPILILQGDADGEALPSGASRLYEGLASADKSIRIIKGADHGFCGTFGSFGYRENLSESGNMVIEEILNWLSLH